MFLLLVRAPDAASYAMDNIATGLDYTSMSDQTLMELLFAEVSRTYTKGFYDANGAFRDVCEWHENIKCDENDRVVSIVHHLHTERLALDYIPPKVEVFAIPNQKNGQDMYGHYTNDCTGNLDISQLPPVLRIFDICQNDFSGDLELDEMPRKVVDFLVGANSFRGSCSLTNLSPQLVRLDLFGNYCDGSVSLEKLPKTLQSLNLGANEFTGSLNFEYLPDSLRILDISRNKFTGEFILDMRSAPIYLHAQRNRFSEAAIISSSASVDVFFGKSGVTKIFDENGDTHEREWKMFVPHEEMISVYSEKKENEGLKPQAHDPGLACCDGCWHPDQLPMQMMLAGITYELLCQIRDSDTFSPLPIHSWDMAGFGHLSFDSEDRINSVKLKMRAGVLYFDHMPLRVENCVVTSEAMRITLTGTLNVGKLPLCMQHLQIADFEFYGNVALTRLPPRFISFIISGNNFEGSCDLTALPENLERCHLHSNLFSGSIHLHSLPEALMELSLHKNKLVGNVIITNLPKGLLVLSIGSNPLDGNFAMTQPFVPKDPKEPLTIWASETDFTGDFIVHSDAQAQWKLDKDKFDTVVDENGSVRKALKKIKESSASSKGPHFFIDELYWIHEGEFYNGMPEEWTWRD